MQFLVRNRVKGLKMKRWSQKSCFFVVVCVLFFFFFLCLFRAAPMAYGGSRARGLIGATAASLCQSHSHSRSKPRLRPTPQLTAIPDPYPIERGQGLKPQPHGS